MSQQLFSNFSPSILQVLLPQKVASANNVAMATPGDRFKRLRLRKGFGQSGLAAAIGLKSAQTISNFEIGKSEKMYLDNWRRVAEVFKVSVDELNEAVFSESSLDSVADDDHELLRDGETKLLVPLDPTGKDFVARYKASGMTLKDFNEKFGGANYPQTAFDNNVGRIPANPLPIPEWSAEIACGHWIDCSTAALDPDTQMAIIRAGRFRVRVMGDSMLPKYKPGACVQFRIVRMDEEALQIGAHYYVQNSDGQCTLKVLKAIEEDAYVLAPTNRKYKPLRIPRQLVSRWAIVETIVVAPWEE